MVMLNNSAATYAHALGHNKTGRNLEQYERVLKELHRRGEFVSDRIFEHAKNGVFNGFGSV